MSRWFSPAALAKRQAPVSSATLSSTPCARKSARSRWASTTVNYPASPDFPTAMVGIEDAANHIKQTAATCPADQRGARRIFPGRGGHGFVTSTAVPDGAPSDTPQPMPPEVANHVAAVALFGTPSTRFMTQFGQPTIVIGPPYVAKTTEYCAAGDPVCGDGGDFGAHNAYARQRDGGPGREFRRQSPFGAQHSLRRPRLAGDTALAYAGHAVGDRRRAHDDATRPVGPSRQRTAFAR